MPVLPLLRVDEKTPELPVETLPGLREADRKTANLLLTASCLATSAAANTIGGSCSPGDRTVPCLLASLSPSSVCACPLLLRLLLTLGTVLLRLLPCAAAVTASTSLGADVAVTRGLRRRDGV